MELAQVVARIRDAEQVQTFQWCRMIELEDLLRAEGRRYRRGEIDRGSWLAVATAIHDAWSQACAEWREAREEAAACNREMDLVLR